MERNEKQKFIRFLKFNNIYEEYCDYLNNKNSQGLTAQIFFKIHKIGEVVYCAFHWPSNKWHYYNTAWMHIWVGLPFAESNGFDRAPKNIKDIKMQDDLIAVNKEYFESVKKFLQ